MARPCAISPPPSCYSMLFGIFIFFVLTPNCSVIMLLNVWILHKKPALDYWQF
uniref:Uncharacterized protein n=1 Tax=Anguilla anguilla TaxID=7936 RepID=A0A0E9W978_ANGAN